MSNKKTVFRPEQIFDFLPLEIHMIANRTQCEYSSTRTKSTSTSSQDPSHANRDATCEEFEFSN